MVQMHPTTFFCKSSNQTLSKVYLHASQDQVDGVRKVRVEFQAKEISSSQIEQRELATGQFEPKFHPSLQFKRQLI
jgi:hypothetical protein